MRRHATASTAGSIFGTAGSRARFGAILVGLLSVLALMPATSLAVETRFPETFSPLDGSGSGLTLIEPGGIAIDEATGNVFVNDEPDSDTSGVSKLSKTKILGGEGGTPAGLVAPFQLEGVGFYEVTNAVAFDNSDSSAEGTVYIIDANKIKKFERNGTTEKYEAAGELTPVGPPGRPFQKLVAGATVDSLGNLYAAEPFCECIVKFNPGGTQIATYDLRPSQPTGIAVDASGNLYVSLIAGSGVIKIPAGASETNPETTKIIEAGNTGVATDPSRNKLYIALRDRVAQYDTSTAVPTLEFEFGVGKLGATERLAVNSVTNRVYVADNGGAKRVVVFAPPIVLPSATTKAASSVTGTRATLNGIVNPQNIAVTDCRFEYGTTASYGTSVPCKEAVPTDSSDHAVSADLTGLEPNGTTYHYRLVVDTALGESPGLDRTLLTKDTVVTEPATSVADTTAILNGSVRPEGTPFTDCKFEYGPTTAYGQTVPCSPPAAAITDDFESHAVTGSPTGLEANTTYHFRLSATNASGTAVGQDFSFTTLGPPQIVQQVPLDVEQQSATLQAKINPSGAATTYYFEWGPAGSYSARIPVDHELFVGSGTEPVVVKADVGGLQPATTYQFRVVARNFRGVETGADQGFETLNKYNLPNGRAAELVSPADKRPAGIVEQLVTSQVYFQPTKSGDRIGYMISNGAEDTPSGGEVIYAGTRSPGGWTSRPVTPPALQPSPDASGDVTDAVPGMVRYFDRTDLKCAVVETHNPVSPDTPAASVEQGVFNLYRWNAADGSYTLLTNRLPLDPEAGGTGNYEVAGASADCSRIIFNSKTYRFLPGASGIYVWEDGVLRDAALRPDGSAPSIDQKQGQEGERIMRAKQSVTADGSYAFPAPSTEAGDEGKTAIFLRKGPGDVVNVSKPTPGYGPDLGAHFEGASTDGSRVFFLANYGLAESSSSGPQTGECPAAGRNRLIHNTACDLYAYDVASGELTDVSASANPADSKGAIAQGVVAITDDGSVVYFAARGQLIPGEGRTYAENLQGEGHANVYRYDFGATPSERLAFVGTLASYDVGGAITGQAMIHSGIVWSAQTDEKGDYLLYSSRDDFGGVNNPEEVELAYVYSHETQTSDCLSCPRDGSQPRTRPLKKPGFPTAVPGLDDQMIGKANATFSSLSDDGRVIFDSEDALAPGAVEGKGEVLGTLIVNFPAQTNIYEWHRGQVSLLATGAVLTYGFGGPNGRDAIIRSYQQLSPYDVDVAPDLYDLRSGGGFAPPPAPVPPCDVQADQCQGPAGQPPAAIPPGTTAPRSGNQVAPTPPKPRCKKGKVRRKGKCVPRKSGKKRSAKANRGGAK